MLALGQTITKEMIPQILQVGNGCEVGYIGTVIFRIIDEQKQKLIQIYQHQRKIAKTYF